MDPLGTRSLPAERCLQRVAIGRLGAGFALDKLTQRVKDQKQNGLTTRIVDRGHKVKAIFYSPDGAAIELKDTASIETQVLDGGTVIHSDQAQIHYYAVMTGAEDRWKVRVLESGAR